MDAAELEYATKWEHFKCLVEIGLHSESCARRAPMPKRLYKRMKRQHP